MSSSDRINASTELPQVPGNRPILVNIRNGDLVCLAKPLTVDRSLYEVSKDTLPSLSPITDVQGEHPSPKALTFKDASSLETEPVLEGTEAVGVSETIDVKVSSFVIKQSNNGPSGHSWELLKSSIEPPKLKNLSQLYYILVKVFFNVPIPLEELRVSKFSLHILVELLMRKNKNSAYKM